MQRQETKKYLVIFEKSKTGYSAYVPDLPGCISAGKTRRETENYIKVAIEFHIEGINLNGEKVPVPTLNYGFVKVKVPARNTAKTKGKRKVTV